MANLENCLPVAAYTAEEFAGDMAYGAAALELQNPPSSAFLTNGFPALQTEAVAGYYYLTIEAESGYHIKAENINIGGVYGEFDNCRQWNYASAVTGSVVPSDISNIRAYDSLSNNTSCSNKVVVEILLQPDFVMPANDYFINIDFGGVAQLCVPVEDSTDGSVVDPEIKFELFINDQAMDQNADGAGGYTIYLAKYYDSEEYASSIYNPNNYFALCYYNPLSTQSIPEYDFNQCWNDENYYNVSPSCLDGFQPTCYSKYVVGVAANLNYGPAAWFDTANTNNVTTSCGALGVSNWGSTYTFANSSHPNIAEFGIVPEVSNFPYQPTLRHHMYRLKFSSSNADNYLSQVDYPFLSPGDGILPPYLCWYISVGNDDNYDLAASTETIDVWKIVSTTFQNTDDPNNMSSQSTGTPAYNVNNIDCSIFGTSGSLTSEKNSSGVVIQNNSNLDISNIEITQPDPLDSKTIKLKIPFQPGFQAEIWDDQFTRNTKIFLNFYANQI